MVWIPANISAALKVDVNNRDSFLVVTVNGDDLVNVSSFYLQKPSRLVLDIKSKELHQFSAKLSDETGLVKAVRHGVRGPELLRVVLELNIDSSKLALRREGATKFIFRLKIAELFTNH